VSLKINTLPGVLKNKHTHRAASSGQFSCGSFCVKLQKSSKD